MYAAVWASLQRGQLKMKSQLDRIGCDIECQSETYTLALVAWII